MPKLPARLTLLAGATALASLSAPAHAQSWAESWFDNVT